MKTILSLIFLTLFLSCSSDDSEIVSTSIDYFTEELKGFNGSTLTSYSKERYDLQDGKYFKRTSTDFTGNSIAFQTHYYNEEGLLKDEFTNMEAHYSYIGQQLVGMTYSNTGGNYNYRRFVAISATTYYIEVLDAPYLDAAAQITQRFIVEFDGNEDVISIGEDANLDGIVDAATYFTYQNGDLVSVQEPNGTIHNYIYSDTVNNYNAIVEKTYGKKSRRLIFIQEYLDVVANSGLVQSTHLKQSAFDNTQYQILSNNYVKKIYFDHIFGSSRVQGTTLFYFK